MTQRKPSWKNPKTGRALKVGDTVHINANARLGPSAMGMFTITSFTDEGILGVPAFKREDYSNAAIRFQPEDIKG